MSDLSTEADQRHLQVLEQFKTGDRVAGFAGPQWWDAIRKDKMLRDAYITVDLVFGRDTVVRMATELVAVTSASTGESFVYLPQLKEEPDWERSYSPGDGAAEVTSLSFSALSELVKPADIIKAGRMLAGYGEVCLQLKGGDYDQRIVLLRGEMTGGVVFGAPGEEIEVELSDPKVTSNLIVPPWITSVDRHATLPDEWVGERYPMVFNGFDGIECIRVEVDTSEPNWLICYDHPFTLDTVYLNGESVASGSAATPWSEGSLVDLQGTRYFAVNFTPGTYVWEDNDSVHADITADVTRDVIEIIEDLVVKFSVLGLQGASASLFSAARAKLPRMLPKVMINSSNAADEDGILTFIEGTLAESFPMVSMVWDSGKYGPIVTDYRLRLPVAEFIAGQYPLIDRVSSVIESSKEELFNYFRVSYSYDPITDTYQGVQTRTPSNDVDCRLSRDQVGAHHFTTIESNYIQDDSHANYVIDWLVAHFSRPWYYLEWEAWPWVVLWLRRGDLIWYTDPEFGWEAERAIVQTISYRRGRAVIGLRVWPGRKRLNTLRD